MTDFNLPPEQEDRLRALGEPIGTFRAGLIGLRIATVLAFVVGLALAAGLPVALLLADAGGKAWVDGSKGIVLGLGLFAAGVGGLRRIRKNKGLRVFVFKDGLARVQGDSADVFRWQDFTTVRRVVATGSGNTGLEPTRRLTLTTTDSKEHEFDESLSGLKRLRQLVEQHTLPHLFPPVLDTCEAGSDYRFGDIKVNSQGLTYRDAQLPWSKCASVEVVKGLVVVKKQGGWVAFCKVPVSMVPNAHVLIAYAEYVRKYAE